MSEIDLQKLIHPLKPKSFHHFDVMSTTDSDLILAPYIWITASILGLSIIIVSGYILRLELKARKSESITFISKSAEIFSLLALVCVLWTGIGVTIWYFNGLCRAAGFVYILSTMTSIFIGFYQLDRLHFCFAQSKVYSNKGYPFWLFVIMYIIGSCILIANSLIFPYISIYRVTSCGINDNGEYFEMYRIHPIFLNNLVDLIRAFNSLLYVFWDLLTLCLYVAKVITFRKFKQDEIVWNRIVRFLSRIIILTMMYEIPFWLQILTTPTLTNRNIIFYICGTLSMISWAFSIFLMQQHNTEYYKWFVSKIVGWKLHYICCLCCLPNELLIDPEKETEERVLDEAVKLAERRKDDMTINSTMSDLTVPTQDNVNTNELSIETTVVAAQEKQQN